MPGTTDSTQLFRACRDIESDRSLSKFIKGYKDIEQQIAGYQFCQPIREAIDLFESWLGERDPLKFFQLVIEAKDKAKVLIDRCKEVCSLPTTSCLCTRASCSSLPTTSTTSRSFRWRCRVP